MTMTKRDPHRDNELIDNLEEAGTPGHQGRGGGNVGRGVGTRGELNQALLGEDDREPVVGQDNPGHDAMKGAKTISRLDPARGGPKTNRPKKMPG
jgi:hypothetical protein